MRLIYFDEAGSSSDELQEPVLTVAAIIVHGDLQTLPIEKDVQMLVEEFVPQALRAGFEFHAKELFSGSNRFRGWRKVERHALLVEFMALIPKHNIPILAVSLDKRGFWRRTIESVKAAWEQEPHWVHEATFHLCAGEVEKWFRANASYERGFCIADETKAKAALKGNFSAVRGRIELSPSALRFDHLIDTVYFGNSHESVFLQFADASAFFIKRTAMKRPDARPFFRVIEAQVSPKPVRAAFADRADDRTTPGGSASSS